MDQPNHTFAKIPILDTRKFEQWKFRIQQYLQNEHYALWEVIEFGDSYEAPLEELGTGSVSESSAKKKGRTVAITTEDMQERRNDVKARKTLLLALLDEHQLRFSKYKTAQELWGSILKTFGGNEATKKTKKNQLKQQYGNFKAEGSETLEQTFNRLQAIVSHLEFIDIEIERDDLNQKFLTSLAPEWLMYTIVWRNRNDLDSLTNTSSGKGEVNTASIPTASTQVSPASANVAAASISHDTVCAYIASQSNGSQIKYEDINQIDEDDIEEMDIKWNMALLRWDWSYMANEEENHALVADDEAPTEFSLMVKSSSSFKNEVFDDSLCSKSCKKNTDSLSTKITNLNEALSDSKTNLYHYKLGLSQVEARLVEFKTHEIKLCKKIRVLKFNVKNKNNKIKNLMNELEQIKKEKEGLDSKLTGFESASKDLDTLLGSQRSDKNKEGLGYSAVPPSCSTDSPTIIKTNKVETVRKPSVKYVKMYRNTSKSPKGNSQNKIDDKGYWDSGCSRHITGNISYLSDYEPYDGGYVSFEKGDGKITGKGIIKTGKLEFENVYFVKDLKYNLFSVSQICDNKNSVLFIDSECIVLGRDFKLKDDTNVLLRTHRQHNMYSIDLNNIVLHKDLTCLVAKASADESMLWHRRCDNGGEFKNKEMNEFCTRKGIKREFSNARTPQQNEVAERRNKTLIEAARTMVLVNKSQYKTPYELFNSRTPVIGFIRPFGCHVMILNTLDHLGKFDAKGDEGYFIRYSMSSKAFRVFNKRTKRVKENLHVDFLENKLIEKGAGPNWLFDIDTLTNSINYVSVVVAGTSYTNFSGIKDVASQDVKKDVSFLRYIALPNWFHEAHLESSTSNAQDACNADAPESSENSNPTATSKNPSTDQMEKLTVESAIPTVSSPIPTACLDDSLKTTIDTNRVEADLSNMESILPASPTPTFKIHKDHPKSQIIGLVDTPVQTRHKSKEMEEHSFIATIYQKTTPDLLQFCLFSCFLSQEEPKKIFNALKDPCWVEAMQEELHQFKIQNVWILVDCPKGMNVKSAFLYGTIDEEVYVMQPPGFQDPEFLDRVYKVEKAMYGLHQAPRAWYGTLSKYLLANGFQRGTIDQTLFIRKHIGDFLLVQVYVDDIIFGSSNPQLCEEFKALMHDKFQMSAMGELNFFLGLQVLQKKDGIFLSQDKYVGDILKKFGYSDVRSMIGSLMYLTASRPDIMFAVYAYAMHQVTPKECHLHAVKRIFRYLKGHLKLGLGILKNLILTWWHTQTVTMVVLLKIGNQLLEGVSFWEED
nr:hypothetical protein [Tanacetum cinerariifolium]